MEDKIKDGFYKIRPAGRHLLTIGRDLIKDKYAAIVELVKNAFDADSNSCTISLLPFERITHINGEEEIKKGIRIIVKDEGHGMTFDTVINKWMVPSTDDKLNRKVSPKGRIMQGKKGIGRYSASMLGDDMVLQTIDDEGELTTLYLIWDNFEKSRYLEDVDVLIENFKTHRSSGTEIIMIGDEYHLNDWNVKQIQNLKFELKKLIPPSNDYTGHNSNDTNDFKIILELGDFPFAGYSNIIEEIEPYPLFELYDYRIFGNIDKNGYASLAFENKRIRDCIPEELRKIKIILNQDSNLDFQAYCGNVQVDFRVYDRDSTSIEGLIERGLKDPITGQYVGKREARIILDTYNGIGVYRNGFRLRPLGDPGYDWLSLDNQRVQNPSLRVGCDQVIGFIHIESEDKSKLEEKSARDGIKESPEYFGLIEIAKQTLKELENRRFAFRKKIGLGRSKQGVNEKITKLYNFAELKEQIDKILSELNISQEKRIAIDKIIAQKEESNNSIADELRQSIALYQGQATLGKIVNVILHEGRKPLGYFKNQIPLIKKWSDKLKDNFEEELYEKILDRIGTIGEQSGIFVKLFEKLDPLSTKRRDRKKEFNILKIINDVKHVFSLELTEKNISIEIDCEKELSFIGWQEDFYIVLTNLVDNSLYWLQQNSGREKSISIKSYIDEGLLIIEYHDSGPGIEKEIIESEIIFDPEFSGKTGGGSGLGLAISGEAIERNDGTLKAIYSEDGAFFIVEAKIQ